MSAPRISRIHPPSFAPTLPADSNSLTTPPAALHSKNSVCPRDRFESRTSLLESAALARGQKDFRPSAASTRFPLPSLARPFHAHPGSRRSPRATGDPDPPSIVCQLHLRACPTLLAPNSQRPSPLT